MCRSKGVWDFLFSCKIFQVFKKKILKSMLMTLRGMGGDWLGKTEPKLNLAGWDLGFQFPKTKIIKNYQETKQNLQKHSFKKTIFHWSLSGKSPSCTAQTPNITGCPYHCQVHSGAEELNGPSRLNQLFNPRCDSSHLIAAERHSESDTRQPCICMMY